MTHEQALRELVHALHKWKRTKGKDAELAWQQVMDKLFQIIKVYKA